MLPYVEYRRGCPRCGGRARASELVELGCCSRCAKGDELVEKAIDVWRAEIEELRKFFVAAVGKEPWSLQLHWMKRLVSGESFAMVAPTGIGKSTLLAVYALYRACVYGWKVYILTPTREIAKQFRDRMDQYLSRLLELGLCVEEPRILFYDSSSSSAQKLRERISSGDFDILITSATFLSRNFEAISRHRMDLVIADDLDALMKRSRNIDRVLKLLGFEDRDIELATRIAKLRQKLLAAKLASKPEIVESIRAELYELVAELRNRIADKRSQLVVASATGRVRGLKPLVMKELLGFEGGALFEYWRNVEDLYARIDELEELLPAIAREMKSGIVLVASGCGVDEKKVAEILERAGIRVAIARSGSRAVDKFRRGDVDVLVGKSSYYGILVRGFDEPIRVRFVAFVGVPRVSSELSNSLKSVRFLYAVLQELRKLGIDVSNELRELASVVQSLTPAMLAAFSKWLKHPEEAPEGVKDRVCKVLEICSRVEGLVLEALKKMGGKLRIGNLALIVREGRKARVIKPDPYTYVQASGRCSRLLNGVKTFGIAVVFEEHRELIDMLSARLRKLVSGIEFRKLVPSDLAIFSRIAEETRSGRRVGRDIREAIRTALIIVESPTKARTIASMFGRPAKRSVGDSVVYETVIPVDSDKVLVATVAASLGHVTDLVTDEGIHGVKEAKGIFVPVYDFITRCRNCGAQHVGVYRECPYCGSPNVSCSYSTFNALKKLAMDVDEVLIGTDPDTEGEKIAFDLATLLKPFNSNIKRIEFHEVTKRAIIEALRNPRGIDLRKVEAQIARRVADRWIGFEVSLWLQRTLDKPWLGAGRVQTPVLLWVVDRYREYRSGMGYAVVATVGGKRLRIFFSSKDEAEEVAKLLSSEGFVVESLEEEIREVAPPPPFTTDELLYEAGRRFGFSAGFAMAIAQTLFESGLITYHRTDSSRVSQQGIAVARQALERLGLESLFVARPWGAREGAQDAHECIRPTSPMSAEEVREAVLRGELGLVTRIGEPHLKLYDLIYRRFLASQMKPSVIRFARAKLSIPGKEVKVEIEVPFEEIESGFTAIYPMRMFKELVEELRKGRAVPTEVKVVRCSRVRLLTVADLVKMLRDKGIGRPSTYAKAIENNVRHGYVVLSKKRKAAIPTKLGMSVADIVKELFLDLVGEDVTRKLEEAMDAIERGEKVFQDVAKEVLELVEKVVSEARVPSEAATASLT